MCLSLSILGMSKKDNNEVKTIEEIKTNSITNLTDKEKEHINNIIVSIFNDSFNKIMLYFPYFLKYENTLSISFCRN